MNKIETMLSFFYLLWDSMKMKYQKSICFILRWMVSYLVKSPYGILSSYIQYIYELVSKDTITLKF